MLMQRLDKFLKKFKNLFYYYQRYSVYYRTPIGYGNGIYQRRVPIWRRYMTEEAQIDFFKFIRKGVSETAFNVSPDQVVIACLSRI